MLHGASKAFDKINYWYFYYKLLNRGLPLFIVKLLCFWNSSQDFMVRWSGMISTSFKVSNGVRQGGVLSPWLFGIYVDDLSLDLTKANVGCYFTSSCVNHLFYADDSMLIAPSSSRVL